MQKEAKGRKEKRTSEWSQKKNPRYEIDPGHRLSLAVAVGTCVKWVWVGVDAGASLGGRTGCGTSLGSTSLVRSEVPARLPTYLTYLPVGCQLRWVPEARQVCIARQVGQ